MNRSNQNKRGSKKRTVLIVLCCVLALILAALIILTVFLRDMLSGIGRVDETDVTLSPDAIESILGETEPGNPDFSGPVLDIDEVVMPSGPAESVEVGENKINFLLVGQDRRKGDPRMHSDAMILVTVDKTEKTLIMTSFMRDLWVQIPGYYKQRLNVPYMLNGFDLLNETLEYNFGVSGEHNIEVDFSGFKSAIDAVDGVAIELTAAEARHLNKENNSWSLQEGTNCLDGEQALAYSRIRKIGDDFERTSRQRTVLMALFDKAKSLSLTELYSLAKTLMPMITTDMTDAEILGYIMELAPLLTDLTIVSQRIPADGAYYNAKINGNEVLCLSEDDWQTNLQILKNTLGN